MAFFLVSVCNFKHISVNLRRTLANNQTSSANDELLTVFYRLYFPLNMNILFILSFPSIFFFAATVFDLFEERGKIT